MMVMVLLVAAVVAASGVNISEIDLFERLYIKDEYDWLGVLIILCMREYL